MPRMRAQMGKSFVIALIGLVCSSGCGDIGAAIPGAAQSSNLNESGIIRLLSDRIADCADGHHYYHREDLNWQDSGYFPGHYIAEEISVHFTPRSVSDADRLNGIKSHAGFEVNCNAERRFGNERWLECGQPLTYGSVWEDEAGRLHLNEEFLAPFTNRYPNPCRSNEVLENDTTTAAAVTSQQNAGLEQQVRNRLEESFNRNGQGAGDTIVNADVLPMRTGELHQVGEITLDSGRRYRFLGACDSQCSRISLSLYKGDTSVGVSSGSADLPVLNITPSEDGLYSVRLRMDACSTEICFGGIRIVFVTSQDGPAPLTPPKPPQ